MFRPLKLHWTASNLSFRCKIVWLQHQTHQTKYAIKKREMFILRICELHGSREWKLKKKKQSKKMVWWNLGCNQAVIWLALLLHENPSTHKNPKSSETANVMYEMSIENKSNSYQTDWLYCGKRWKCCYWFGIFSKMMLMFSVLMHRLCRDFQGKFNEVKTKLITQMIWEQVIRHHKRIKSKPICI